jgi:hypothetical protein
VSKPQVLFAVTDGEYSDFSVIAVFERATDAEDARLAGLGDDVIEMPYFPAGSVPKRVRVHRAQATAYRNGRLQDVAVREFSTDEWVLGDNPASRRPRVKESRWPNGAGVGVVVECASANLALKALHDRLARIYAEFAGLSS